MIIRWASNRSCSKRTPVDLEFLHDNGFDMERERWLEPARPEA